MCVGLHDLFYPHTCRTTGIASAQPNGRISEPSVKCISCELTLCSFQQAAVHLLSSHNTGMSPINRNSDFPKSTKAFFTRLRTALMQHTATHAMDEMLKFFYFSFYNDVLHRPACFPVTVCCVLVNFTWLSACAEAALFQNIQGVVSR